MHRSTRCAGALVTAVALATSPLMAKATTPTTKPSIPQLEQLDRGLAVARNADGNFLSWRFLRHEATGATATGLTGANFRVYRDGEPIAMVTDSTNYVDQGASLGASYQIGTIVNGIEIERSEAVRPWSTNHTDIPLDKPADGVTPPGEAYTYSANDVSVGDVDGDGSYEYFVKWYPSNAKDVSQVGYTGKTYIDCYRADGTRLYRIDLGVNIRSGAHYTQFLVQDFDGDGTAELMMKTAPGTQTIGVEGSKYVTLPTSDVKTGVTNADDYRMSAADYREHLIAMFKDWTKHPEVVAGHWPATLEEAFGIPKAHDYPLSDASASALVDYFIDVYAPSRSARNQLRNFEGFILTGPEYLTVFDGATGVEKQTIHYEPGRHDDGLMWGDYAMGRIEPGNRVDRFLANVAYLGGTRPSAVFSRGYYTRANLVAYDWDGKQLVKRWAVDSGWTPMKNPFNDGPHGVDGTDPEYATLTTQGFHSVSAADVDNDGRQEIVYGSATIDDDGSLLYSSFDQMPAQSATPGTRSRLGHGDAMHVADLDPSRPGLEIFSVHEGGAWAPYGYAMRDAATGRVLWGGYTGKDTGRGMVGDIDPTVPGYEAWAVDLRSADGKLLAAKGMGTNQSIRWAGDMTTQVVDGARDVTPTIVDHRRGVLLTATGTLTNNDTKGNPSLVADVLGDWREELVVRTADSSALRIYLSTEPTQHKLYSLMQDPQYRVEVARQQTAYNQPSYPSFYLASDMDFRKVPLTKSHYVGLVGSESAAWAALVDESTVTGPWATQVQRALEAATRHDRAGQRTAAVTAIDRAIAKLEDSRRGIDPATRLAWLQRLAALRETLA